MTELTLYHLLISLFFGAAFAYVVHLLINDS